MLNNEFDSKSRTLYRGTKMDINRNINKQKRKEEEELKKLSSITVYVQIAIRIKNYYKQNVEN